MAVEARKSENLYKLPPQNIEAEQSVLGAVLLDNSALHKVLEVLEEGDFYKESHTNIFKAIINLFERNEPVDLVTLTNIMKEKGTLDKVGGASYLASLVEYVPTSANVSYYARIVKEKALLRELISVAAEIVEEAHKSTGGVEEFLDRAERTIFNIVEQRSKRSYLSIKDIITETFRFVEKRFEKKELISGVPTGFVRLDNLTSGFQDSELVIIAGRPSHGKTAFALNISLNAALHTEKPKPVAIFSLEMTKEQLALRLLSSESRVEGDRLRSGLLLEQHWQRLAHAGERLSMAPIFIDDTPALTILALRAKARRLKKEHDVGMIVVDYLQLMQGSADADTREQEISSISRSLKALAKDLSIPIVALSQLSRRAELHSKKPQLSDLRESGALEQDADLIMFIYRDEVFNHDSTEKGKAEIIIGKQRNGPLGSFRLNFHQQFTLFESERE